MAKQIHTNKNPRTQGTAGSWVSLLKMIVNEKGQQKQQEHGQQHPAIGMRVVVALCHCCGRGWQSSGGGFPS